MIKNDNNRHPKEQEEQKLLETMEPEMAILKDEYEEIQIPSQLKTKVLGAINKGKDEKKIRRICIRTGQTAAAALLAITVLANSGAGVAYAMEQIPVIGAITRVVTFRTYESRGANTEAKVEIPRIEAEKDSGISHAARELNKSVEEYTNQIIAKFEEDVKAGGGQLHEALYSSYEVISDNDKMFTLRINTTQVMAGGAESVKIYSIDKKNDRILALKDMFPQGTDYVGILSAAVKTQMEAHMMEGEEKSYFLNDGMDSDFKAIKVDQNFYINDAGHMVLVFDEYEVAPGYMGVVEIEIPELTF